MIKGAFSSLVKRFAVNEDGATAIEYGLVAVIISISIIAAVEAIGSGSVVGYLTAVINAFASLL